MKLADARFKTMLKGHLKRRLARRALGITPIKASQITEILPFIKEPQQKTDDLLVMLQHRNLQPAGAGEDGENLSKKGDLLPIAEKIGEDLQAELENILYLGRLTGDIMKDAKLQLSFPFKALQVPPAVASRLGRGPGIVERFPGTLQRSKRTNRVGLADTDDFLAGQRFFK